MGIRIGVLTLITIALLSPASIFAAQAGDITEIQTALNSSDPDVRREAIFRLLELDTPEAGPLLASATRDRSELVRAAAITGLARPGLDSYVSLVAERLRRDRSTFVKKAAAYALGVFGSPVGTAELTRALRARNREVRASAATALGEYADPAAVGPLVRALRDREGFVRAQAARALGTNARFAGDTVNNLIPIAHRDDYGEARRQATIALGLIGDPSAVQVLRDISRDPDPYLSEAAIEAIERIANRRATP